MHLVIGGEESLRVMQADLLEETSPSLTLNRDDQEGRRQSSDKTDILQSNSHLNYHMKRHYDLLS